MRRMNPRKLIVPALLSATAVLLVVACSSNDSTPVSTPDASTQDSSMAAADAAGNGATDAQGSALPTLAEFCADDTARFTRCTDGGTRACNESSYGCVTGMLKTDVAVKMLDCLSKRSCGISDDACLSGSITPVASDETFSNACSAKFDACRGDGGTDTWGFLCGYPPSAMKPALGTTYAACIEKAGCKAIGDCLSGVFDSVGCQN